MFRDECLGGGAKAIPSNCLPNRLRPRLGQRGVELLRATMDLASLPSSLEQADLRHLSAVPTMQHPSDAEALQMADTSGQHRARLPRVSEFVAGHRPRVAAALSAQGSSD